MLVNRLYRSRTDTILGGVASGLATYLNADPALVRIAWAVLVPLTGGIAFLAYIVGWVVIPEEPAPAAGADGVLGTDGRSARWMYDAVMDAVRSGELPEARLNEAAARMTALAGGDPQQFACTAATMPQLD